MAFPLPKPIRAALETRANEHVGLLAEFSDPGALHDAVVDLRKRGYTRLDTFSPFPIHGMDRAMGLPVSKLAFLVFGGALVGLLSGYLLQWWTSAVDYPINISNKPLFAIESSVPIMFELTILFSALTAVGAMLALNGLPKPYDPLFHSERFGRVTDDAFFLHVGEADSEFVRATTAGDLFGLGALAVEYVDHAGATDLSHDGEPRDSGAPAPVLVTPPFAGSQI
ncbi:MAG TPA: DUF3341 domain-containing protein [Rubricoccaceae bacterium]|jgi:hypothetical protein